MDAARVPCPPRAMGGRSRAPEDGDSIHTNRRRRGRGRDGRPGRRLLPVPVRRDRGPLGPLHEGAPPRRPRGRPEHSYKLNGSRIGIRLSNAAHESRPWRICEIAPDFTVEDVWALPALGGAEDFQTLLEVMVSLDPASSGFLPPRILWRLRDRLGSWFGLGRISAPLDHGRDEAAGKLPIPGTDKTSLAGRLPDDLRDTAADPDFAWTPFAPLYRTDVEFAAEL